MLWIPTVSKEVSRRCIYIIVFTISNEGSRKCIYIMDILIKVGRHLVPDIKLNDNPIITLRSPSKIDML